MSAYERSAEGRTAVPESHRGDRTAPMAFVRSTGAMMKALWLLFGSGVCRLVGCGDGAIQPDEGVGELGAAAESKTFGNTTIGGSHAGAGADAATDFDGQSRPLGAPDSGAHERQ